MKTGFERDAIND